MIYAGQFSADRIWQILLVQVTSGLLAAGGAAYLDGGLSGAVAALYGAGVAVVNTLLLAWRMHRGKVPVQADAYAHLRSLYRAWLERLAAIIFLLAAGLGLLELAAGALLAGFIVGHLGFLLVVLLNRQ